MKGELDISKTSSPFLICQFFLCEGDTLMLVLAPLNKIYSPFGEVEQDSILPLSRFTLKQ
jgi:hypothetical protein